MGQLLEMYAAKKKRENLWFKKLYHFFLHSWSNWTEGEVINIYAGTSRTDIPYRRELRQERKCAVCNKKDIRRLDY